MGLFRKKCAYCKKKIEKGRELLKDVKVPEFVGTRPKIFCSEGHFEMYKKEVNEKSKCGSGGGCCG